MDDLIRRSDALAQFAESTSAMPEKQGRRRIEELPAVDAVEVVRCRECKHRYYYEEEHIAPVCTASMAYVNTPDDWFCKDGQQRGR